MKTLCCGATTAWKRQNEVQREDRQTERKCSYISGPNCVQHIVKIVGKLLFTAALLLNSQSPAPMQGSNLLI